MELLHELLTTDSDKLMSALAFAFVFTVIVPAVVIRFRRAV